jgi:NADPH2:quinone reductase
VVGFAAGGIPRVPLNLPLLKGCSILGVFWGAAMVNEPECIEAELQELATWAHEGKLHPHVHAVYPLERAADALNDMMNRRVVGKVVLTTGL